MTSLNALLVIVAVTNPGDTTNSRQAGTPSNVRILRFTADWCPACKAMDSTVQRLQQAGIPISNVNVDRDRQMASRYRITQVPTMIMTVDGKATDRLSGQAGFDRIATWYRRSGGQSLRSRGSNNRPTVRGQSPQGSRLDELLAQRPAAIDPPARTGGRPVNRGGDRSPAIASPQTASAGNNGPSRSFRETGQRQEAGNRQDSRAESRAFQATVRIKVEDEKGFSFGTGTIIDVHKQEALIITCGHLFRESRGRGQILVDLNVPNARQPVRAELIAWDAGKRDIAVLSIRPNVPVVAVPVAGQRVNPRRGQAVFSVGCDQGRPATIRRSHIVTVNRYQGPANIEVQGHPSVGRSGGGLFNQEGQLIGVCRAADLEEDQGIYGGLPVIYGQLDRIHQSHLYRDRQPRVLEAGPSRLAGNRSDRGPQGDSLRAMPASRPQPTASADRPTELICIVRDANGKQRTIVVRDPSAQLVRQVQDAAGNSQLARRDRAPDDNRPLTIRGQDVR